MTVTTSNIFGTSGNFHTKETKDTKNFVSHAIDFGSATIRGIGRCPGSWGNEVFAAKTKGAIGCNSVQRPNHGLGVILSGEDIWADTQVRPAKLR